MSNKHFARVLAVTLTTYMLSDVHTGHEGSEYLTLNKGNNRLVRAEIEYNKKKLFMSLICDFSALIFKLQHHYISNVNTSD